MQAKNIDVNLFFGFSGILAIGVLLATLAMAGGGVEPYPLGSLVVCCINFFAAAAVAQKAGMEELTRRILAMAVITVIATPVLFWLFLFSQAYGPLRVPELFAVVVFGWVLLGPAIVLTITQIAFPVPVHKS